MKADDGEGVLGLRLEIERREPDDDRQGHAEKLADGGYGGI